MEKMREKECEVKYKKPDWMDDWLEEEKKKKAGFVYPATRLPNPTHVRKRKERLIR